MRKFLLGVSLAMILGACSGSASSLQGTSEVTYDSDGFDENGCNRGEAYQDDLCHLIGECSEAGDALNAYMAEHGPDGSSEYARLDREYYTLDC